MNAAETTVFKRLYDQFSARWQEYERLWGYYNGSERLIQIGISVPEAMRLFELFVAWPEVTVEAIVERADLRALIRPGEVRADDYLMELADYNDLQSEVVLHNRDKLIYGRAFWTVGSNELDPRMPLIRAESPRNMEVLLDPRTRAITAALRVYGDFEFKKVEGAAPVLTEKERAFATLYLPDVTITLERVGGRWETIERDEHRLGRVPIVMTMNRRLSGSYEGRSEMGKIIPITDGCARALSNMQMTSEFLAIPQRWVAGIDRNDFVDEHGNPVTKWETYFGGIFATEQKDAKFGTYPAADLSGFHDTVKLYGQLAASVTGYPAKYFGNFTTNPPAEGAIKAEEARLVKTVELSCREVGTTLGWACELAERFTNGDWPERNRVKVEWHDPATPTVAQRADAIQKLAGGTRILSREGAWDELGWSEARKARERDNFQREQAELLALGDSMSEVEPDGRDE